jgi:hypothetical protein
MKGKSATPHPSRSGTRDGRLVFGIFGSIAEIERELIRERVRSGMATLHRVAQGRSRNLSPATPCKWLNPRGAFFPVFAFQKECLWYATTSQD